MNIRKVMSIGTICISVFMLTACGDINLSSEEKKLVVDYAANTVLKHDRNYQNNLANVEIEPETETVWHSEKENTTTANDNNNNSNNQGEDETTAINVETDLNAILNLKGLEVTYSDYVMTGAYPTQSDLAFVINAAPGDSLIVVKLNVKNTTSGDIKLDMLSKNMKFKGIFNSKVKTNCQTTMLSSAFNTYKGTIKAGESKEMELVFEVSKNSLQTISTIKLEVTNDKNSETIILKK